MELRTEVYSFIGILSGKEEVFKRVPSQLFDVKN